MRLRRKPQFKSPDDIHRAKEADVLADPDEPSELVLLQVEDTDGKIVHIRMTRGEMMMVLLRGSQELRVDIGLGRAGDYTRWDALRN
jgi:hypothetical protein